MPTSHLHAFSVLSHGFFLSKHFKTVSKQEFLNPPRCKGPCSLVWLRVWTSPFSNSLSHSCSRTSPF